jgi:hypothetical protein
MFAWRISPSVPARKKPGVVRDLPPTKASVEGGRDKLDPPPVPATTRLS